MELQKFSYDNKVVKYFLIATIFWGVIGFLFGLTVATLLGFPELHKAFGIDQNLSVLGYGRWRMLHTNVVIFGFVGNAIFAGVYYSLQRLLKTRMYSDTMSWLNFWGWQLVLVSMMITYFMGYNTSKEYAEAEWPVDILLAIVWVLFGIHMFLTIKIRRITHLYVAIWFYIATFFAVGLLHVFNNLELPVSLTSMKSYSVYAGVQDALMQWWYGHNAVAFFLTTPILGLMYYFVPKISQRPVFSYKLSIIHFWSLIFIYIWAGPHHLIYTALPNWCQVLGTAFSMMLIAPSWGGMLNGLLTLRGAWDKVRTDPSLKFLVVALTCYGMATFEGPILATKTLNSIGHYTNWIIAHVHVGALGWNGLFIFGMSYWLVPTMWKTKLYSTSLANTHFWLATLGIIFYVIPIYTAGFLEYLTLKEFTEQGTLANKNFIDILTDIKPMYYLRMFGGILYVAGSFVMVYNLYKTAKAGSFVENEEAEAKALPSIDSARNKEKETYHTWLERTPVWLTVLSVVALLVGTLIEIAPTLLTDFNKDKTTIVSPLTPLELEGRDLYIREGCNACHSQMIRPFRDEVMRYSTPQAGFSKSEEYVYDHPFLWGSRRTGPDLAREGLLKASPGWHYEHFANPRNVEQASIMPSYPWLLSNSLSSTMIKEKMETLQTLGVPFKEEDIKNADKLIEAQKDSLYNQLIADGATKVVQLYEDASGKNIIASMIDATRDKYVTKLETLEDQQAELEKSNPKYSQLQKEIDEITAILATENDKIEAEALKLAKGTYKEGIKNSEVIALIAYIKSLGTKLNNK